MVYLVKTEVRNGSYFKVGFTSNLDRRINHYLTHNPNCELLEIVQTYHKTKHQLESEIHRELVNKCFDFKVEPNGVKTEWFFVPMDKEKEFQEKGLSQFDCCKNRVIYKA